MKDNEISERAAPAKPAESAIQGIIDQLPFEEYRCRECHKLLVKCKLVYECCQVQIKCKKCGLLNLFTGKLKCAMHALGDHNHFAKYNK